jgi:hypothetical protein
MSTPIDLQPETDEVLQMEPEPSLTTVPVCVQEIKSPVRTQELPRKLGTTQTKSISANSQRVLKADHFRAQAIVVSFDQDMLVAFNMASAQDPSTMSRWPALVPMVVTTMSEVWVAAFTATSSVSITTERWATGE